MLVNGTSTIMTDAAVGLPHRSGISSSSSSPSSPSADHSVNNSHSNSGGSTCDININIKSGGGGGSSSDDHTATLNGKTECSTSGSSESNSDMNKMKTPNVFKKTLANSKNTMNGDPVLHCGFNIISVTGIVFVNKLVFATGFKFPVTLTFFHIVMTAIGMRVFR